jgi:16S rRNA G966 N2-methylase RsmD
MATKSLEQMRDKLYQAFDKAIDRTNKYQDYELANQEKLAAATGALEAASRAADAVVRIEQAIAMRNLIKELRAEGADIEVDMEKGLVRSISPMSKIKLKQPET